MKIDNRRLFTYPVLADGRDDYKNGKFNAACNCTVDEDDNLILNANFSTDCAQIKDLIASGDAEYLLHVESPLTFYREIFTSREENFSCKIKRNRVKKNLECLALIVLNKNTANFFCDDWNEDFSGLNFKLQTGTVLAYQGFKTLQIPDDPKTFKNVASIFVVYKRRLDNAEDFYDVEPEADKIKIGLNAKEYSLYRRYCSRPELQPILNAMIILPALVYVFEELKADAKDDFDTYGAREWFLSLKAAYRRRKIDLAAHLVEKTSLELAQEVMNLPLTKALESIAHVFDAEDS